MPGLHSTVSEALIFVYIFLVWYILTHNIGRILVRCRTLRGSPGAMLDIYHQVMPGSLLELVQPPIFCEPVSIVHFGADLIHFWYDAVPGGGVGLSWHL